VDWSKWRIKKEIELKSFSRDIHCPGNMDKISQHSGISVPLGMTKKKKKKKEKKEIEKNWIYTLQK
jgi:hypothetical protein